MNTLASRIPVSWREPLASAIEAESFATLSSFVDEERATQTIYPPAEHTFAALDACNPQEVRVVVLGQDPYHGPGQAHGLAFSVRQGQAIPPSLRNIYKEREADLGIPPARHGELTHWAEQGVLLLNTVLTVRASEAHSHKKRGWEAFTDAVFKYLSASDTPRIFVLWGRPAQKKAKLIGEQHVIFESAHPSPLSARRGFFDSRPFSRINAQLDAWGHRPIDWRVEGE